MANPTDNWLFTPTDGTQLPPLPQLGQRKLSPPVDPWASLGQMMPQSGAAQMPPMPVAGGLNLQQFTQQQNPRDMFMPYLMNMAAQQMFTPTDTAPETGAPRDSETPSTSQAAAKAKTEPVSAQVTAGGDQGTYQQFATSMATKYGIDPSLFAKQIGQESGWDPNAGSGAGAIGIAQFMPGTAAGLGIDPTDPYQSLDGAARLMADYVKRLGSYRAAAIAYNAGEGNYNEYLKTGYLPDETKQYLTALGLD